MFVSLCSPSSCVLYYYEKRNSLPYFNWENTSKCHRILKPFFCFVFFFFCLIFRVPHSLFLLPPLSHMYNTSLMRCLWKARTPFTILIKWTFFPPLPLSPFLCLFFQWKTTYNVDLILSDIVHSVFIIIFFNVWAFLWFIFYDCFFLTCFFYHFFLLFPFNFLPELLRNPFSRVYTFF